VKNNPTIILKVPEGIVRKANEVGVLSNLLFYYKLKSIKIDGFFKIETAIKEIQAYTKLSIPNIYKQINALRYLKWIKKDKTGYSIINYDSLFEKMGYSVELKEIGDTGAFRKGTFKIFKVLSAHLDKFITYIAYEEIKLSLNRQRYRLKKKLGQDSRFDALIQKQKMEFKLWNDGFWSSLTKFESIKEQINRYLGDNKSINLDITLSTRGISRILGFKSSSKGYRIEKELEKLKLIQIIKRNIVFDNTYDFNVLRRFLGLRALSDSFKYKNSVIYYTLSNKLIPLI